MKNTLKKALLIAVNVAILACVVVAFTSGFEIT
jgi:hypothetical protein